MASLVTEKQNYQALMVEENLQRNPETTLEACAKRFFEKGGTLECYTGSELEARRIKLPLGAAIYPVCSAGWCRSQALYAFLEKYNGKIELFAPHGTRFGWDPLAGHIDRAHTRDNEKLPDEFPLFFGRDRLLRFGFENDAEWQKIEAEPTKEGLERITRYYNDNYYSSKSNRQRIYITFERNAHVVMHRLCQANASLTNVKVIGLNLADTMTKPPASLKTTPLSKLTYHLFIEKLEKLFDTSAL